MRNVRFALLGSENLDFKENEVEKVVLKYLASSGGQI